MTDYTAFQTAGDIQPLPTGGATRSLLQDADRALFHALAYWRWVIETYPGPRLVLAACSARVQGIDHAVAQAYPWEPGPEFRSADFRFPLLCAWRTSSVYRKKTAGWFDAICSFRLMYCLPPLHAGQVESILPILHSVEQAIYRKTMVGADPLYTPPGAASGSSPWGLSAAQLEEISLDRGSYGSLPDVGTLWLPCLSMEGTFIERDMPVAADNKFVGGDVQVDTAGTPNLNGSVLVATEVGPGKPG